MPKREAPGDAQARRDRKLDKQGGYPLETEYVRSLLARTSVEFSDVRLLRRNTGVIALEDRVFRAGIPGQADLYALARGGRHYEIECKRFKKLSAAQERWRDWCAQWEIPWLILEVDKTEQPSETVDRWIRQLSRLFAMPEKTASPRV